MKFIESTPRRGIEPWPPAWQAGILTTVLASNRWAFKFYLVETFIKVDVKSN